MKIYYRSTIICGGEIHSKPCSDWNGPKKPKPKPQDEEFITEKEFKF
jgi:hypothetical protein